jgi:hypothetical protein
LGSPRSGVHDKACAHPIRLWPLQSPYSFLMIPKGLSRYSLNFSSQLHECDTTDPNHPSAHNPASQRDLPINGAPAGRRSSKMPKSKALIPDVISRPQQQTYLPACVQ